ncbi:hypothetical protein PF005_g27338 [Phytophthora fragariae]|uniref:Secreted protein n=1 Tax=Phytophthora fragariae TaxID=53985 RepID=A0A6A3W097_9STRA|nr:hypothetical protein PF003_g21228 [Phytophthora fragariae]KAE8921728.1 hypothetical protein PF009_g27998 [Phytophthora fragariae]KAE8969076.1 hypothetical protein PF011_g26943 [Phytophthora fragariae]KAE9069243.1 hypothetical protein PF007_g27392 [Phytophthora fragariae]KAE9074980.1 hypothetical protein PF006_g28427 [Phytophthora fragariae]
MLKVILCCGSTLCVRVAVLFHRRCSSTRRWKWPPTKASRRRYSRRLTHGAVGSCAGTSCPFVRGLARVQFPPCPYYLIGGNYEELLFWDSSNPGGGAVASPTHIN